MNTRLVAVAIVAGITFWSSAVVVAEEKLSIAAQEIKDNIVQMHNIVDAEIGTVTPQGHRITPAYKNRMLQLHLAIFNERYQKLIHLAEVLSKKNRACKKAIKKVLSNSSYDKAGLIESSKINNEFLADLNRLVDGYSQDIVPDCRIPVDVVDKTVFVKR